jgi:pyruvate/2-oxoglutarate dehydrogenase complex dihydrolipoamide dehydrogenase (E3) component
LVHQEDDDVAEALQRLFEDQGIDVLLNVRIQRVSRLSGRSLRVVIEQSGAQRTLEGRHLWVASGRAPNTENMGLELAGVELTSSGYVKVNERLETTAPGVWAVGDVNSGPKFTHISFDDSRVVNDNLNGANHATTGRSGPFCLSDPELARVGAEREGSSQPSIA